MNKDFTINDLILAEMGDTPLQKGFHAKCCNVGILVNKTFKNDYPNTPLKKVSLSVNKDWHIKVLQYPKEFYSDAQKIVSENMWQISDKFEKPKPLEKRKRKRVARKPIKIR